MSALLPPEAAHRAIDRQAAIQALLANEAPKEFQTLAPVRDRALAFIAACQRMYLARHQQEIGQ